MSYSYSLGAGIGALIQWPDENEAVVYSSGSGDLHLIDISVVEVLRQSQSDLLTHHQLLSLLEQRLSGVDRDQIEGQYLPQLLELGLLQRTPQ